nr:hypothetical protein BaRGS_017488 [Batillaria attramentaria]
MYVEGYGKKGGTSPRVNSSTSGADMEHSRSPQRRYIPMAMTETSTSSPNKKSPAMGPTEDVEVLPPSYRGKKPGAGGGSPADTKQKARSPTNRKTDMPTNAA